MLLMRAIGLILIIVCIGIVLKAQVDHEPEKLTRCTLCRDEDINPGFCDDRSNCGLED